MELYKLSFAELLTLQKDIDQAIKLREKEAKAEVKRQILELARQHGLTLDELTSGGQRTRAAVMPKYANPANPTQTWTGRGRKPLWVAEILNTGKSLDDFMI